MTNLFTQVDLRKAFDMAVIVLLGWVVGNIQGGTVMVVYFLALFWGIVAVAMLMHACEFVAKVILARLVDKKSPKPLQPSAKLA